MRNEDRRYVFPAVFKKHEDGRYTAFFGDFERNFYVEGDSMEECFESAGLLLCLLVRFFVESWGAEDPEPTPLA